MNFLTSIKILKIVKKLSAISIILRGMAMGIADVVPGVSGGTIALLLGIYEQFIKSLSEIDISWLKLLLTFKFKTLWNKPGFQFLSYLGLGILSAILLGSRIILYSLGQFPEMVWALFFGLVLASIVILIKREPSKTFISWGLFIIGASLAYGITMMNSLSLGSGSLSILFAGMLAIMAMLLPGISGSYILLIIGKYQLILGSLKNPFAPDSIVVVMTFAVGAILGLLMGSRFLKWLLRHYHHQCLMTLIGFMLGALPKLWPWKSDIEWSSYNIGVIGVIFLSFLGILLLEKLSRKQVL